MRAAAVRSIVAALALAGAAHSVVSLAQSPSPAYPTKPVRLVVPFSTGGAVDVPARVLAQKLGELWNMAVVVDNRPGAGSTIGAEVVAKSPPDGYTVLITSNTHVISANLYRKLAYDPIGDFEPLMEVGSAPNVLVVHPDFPARTVGELVELAKTKPGQIDYGSSGNGSSQHLFCALFASMTSIQLNHIPYKGSGQATTDLLAGRVPVSCPGVNNVLPHIKAGKLRALAVTSARRSVDLPDTPTMAEAGVAGYDATLWIGILVPKGTSRAVMNKLYADISRMLAQDDVKQSLASTGTEVGIKSGEAFAQLLQEEMARWAKLIAETGAKVE